MRSFGIERDFLDFVGVIEGFLWDSLGSAVFEGSLWDSSWY